MGKIAGLDGLYDRRKGENLHYAAKHLHPYLKRLRNCAGQFMQLCVALANNILRQQQQNEWTSSVLNSPGPP